MRKILGEIALQNDRLMHGIFATAMAINEPYDVWFRRMHSRNGEIEWLLIKKISFSTDFKYEFDVIGWQDEPEEESQLSVSNWHIQMIAPIVSLWPNIPVRISGYPDAILSQFTIVFFKRA